jgi:hypothetical protein
MFSPSNKFDPLRFNVLGSLKIEEKVKTSLHNKTQKGFTLAFG